MHLDCINKVGHTQSEKGRRHRVAILVEDLSDYSGVHSVVLFLYGILSTSGRYEPEIISLSSSRRDANSTRVLSPSSWFRKAIQTSGEWHGLPYRHVGAEFTELEFQRYRPRRILTDLLNEFEIVQVVSGIPPWGLVAKNCTAKVALQIATLAEVERVSMLKKVRGVRRAWLWLMTRINAALEGPALRRADLVFVENRWLYERLKAEHGERKIKFALPGVDTDFYCQNTYQPNGYLLSVGRFGDPRKNVRMLFDVYRQLRDAMKDAPRMFLAGESLPAADDLAYAESLGILPYLDIQKSVSIEELRTLYQHASLFLLTSNEEGLGLVIAEAMACGIPVISTRSGGPEMLVVEGETGEFTPVGDALAMSLAIHALLQDSERRSQMSTIARRHAVEHFSIPVTGKVFLDHYDELPTLERKQSNEDWRK